MNQTTNWIARERATHADEIAALKTEIAEQAEKIADLVRYLNSDKFYQDPTVQVADVMTRLGMR